MHKPKVLLIDTSVWLDFFLSNSRYGEEARQLFEICAEQDIILAYAPTTFKDVFYLIPRRLRAQAVAEGADDANISYKPAAWACIRLMTDIAIATTLALPECHIAYSLRRSGNDLEDNLILAVAETNKADYVVTYDKELLTHFAPVCVTPAQVLAMLRW